jgi:hypothetical protein
MPELIESSSKSSSRVAAAEIRADFEPQRSSRARRNRSECSRSNAGVERLAACRRTIIEACDVGTDNSWRDRLNIGPSGIDKEQQLLERAPGWGISPQDVLATTKTTRPCSLPSTG